MASEASAAATTRPGLPAGRIWTIGLVTAAVVTVVNLLLLLVANAAVDPDVPVEAQGEILALPPAVLAMFSFVPVVLATALLWFLGSVVKLRFAVRVVQVAIVALTLLNIVPPLGLDVPATSKAFLEVAHLVVAVPALVALTRAAAPAPAPAAA